MTTKRDRRLAEVIRDPARFANVLLGIDLWETQKEILRSVAEQPRTAVKACHASSKTFTAAVAALWWVTRFPDGVVITTAPTWTQVRRQIWSEVHRIIAAARIDYPEPTQTELRLGPGRYAVGLSTDQGVRFQGHHGHILVIVDEAPGVDAEIWEAIEGIRAGGDVHVLALGNPTVPGGSFYDAFTSQRSSWSTFTISAFDTPNLRGLSLEQLLELPDEELDQSARPYLVTRRWVREKWADWGRHDAPQWRSRVLGEFPEQGPDSLFSLAWLDRWQRQGAADDPNGPPLEVGIDVAGAGKSETVVAVRQDADLLSVTAWPSEDPRGEVVALLNELRPRLSWVKVDAVGQGYYFGQHLADLGFPVINVNVGQASGEPTRFVNLKAELYWTLRMYAEQGRLRGLGDDIAYAQLASLRYEFTPRGQVAIESKKTARRRGVVSPDRAEAIMLAYAPLRVTVVPDEAYLEEQFERNRVRISPF
jgi:hypothetical protein